MSRPGVIIIYLLFASGTCFAQRVVVEGRFFADSLKIGEPVPYSLTARYPKELNLVFPDSTYNFTPFEFSRKVFLPTVTHNGLSYDSTVYYLSSYEIDSVQFAALPVFVIHPGDCTVLFPKTDTIYLKHLVENVPDSLAAPQLPLKTQTSYLNVKWLLNYPLLLIIGGSLVVAAVLVWIFFGKRIRKYFQIKKLVRQHQQFCDRFNETVRQLSSSYSLATAERALSIWKQYLENLEAHPYTKYTSKEIVQVEKDQQLASALTVIDRMIYGGRSSDLHTFSALMDHSQNKFNQKLEAVRHE